MGNSKLITTASLSFALVGMIMISGISPAALAANIPSTISVDPSGHVIASDGVNNRTPKFSITANDQFIPAGVGIDPQGHVFVSDFANNRILKFSNTGDFIREWGTAVQITGNLMIH